MRRVKAIIPRTLRRTRRPSERARSGGASGILAASSEIVMLRMAFNCWANGPALDLPKLERVEFNPKLRRDPLRKPFYRHVLHWRAVRVASWVSVLRVFRPGRHGPQIASLPPWKSEHRPSYQTIATLACGPRTGPRPLRSPRPAENVPLLQRAWALEIRVWVSPVVAVSGLRAAVVDADPRIPGVTGARRKYCTSLRFCRQSIITIIGICCDRRAGFLA